MGAEDGAFCSSIHCQLTVTLSLLQIGEAAALYPFVIGVAHCHVLGLPVQSHCASRVEGLAKYQT
jgi:hypothetical protein